MPPPLLDHFEPGYFSPDRSTPLAEDVLRPLLSHWHILKDQREEASTMSIRHDERMRLRMQFENANDGWNDAEMASEWRQHLERLTWAIEALERVLQIIDAQYPQLKVWNAMLSGSLSPLPPSVGHPWSSRLSSDARRS
jgi:hypothetical protein